MEKLVFLRKETHFTKIMGEELITVVAVILWVKINYVFFLIKNF